MYNSIYPVQIKPYVPPQNQKQVDGKEENESSQSSDMYKSRRSGGTDPYGATDPNGRSSYPRHEYPNGQKSTIDYSKSKVNIAQIITDFKSTANAIGAPPTIIQEVDQYLALAENQSLKNDPDKKLIQSNLKNASNVLDKFISQTLNKKSKVVENWIEALFLQQVDYKSDPSTVNEDFLVKLPDKETGAEAACEIACQEKLFSYIFSTSTSSFRTALTLSRMAEIWNVFLSAVDIS